MKLFRRLRQTANPTQRIQSLAELAEVWEFIELPEGDAAERQDLRQLWQRARHEVRAEESGSRSWFARARTAGGYFA